MANKSKLTVAKDRCNKAAKRFFEKYSYAVGEVELAVFPVGDDAEVRYTLLVNAPETVAAYERLLGDKGFKPAVVQETEGTVMAMDTNIAETEEERAEREEMEARVAANEAKSAADAAKAADKAAAAEAKAAEKAAKAEAKAAEKAAKEAAKAEAKAAKEAEKAAKAAAKDANGKSEWSQQWASAPGHVARKLAEGKPPFKPGSKRDITLSLLKSGATAEEGMAALGWNKATTVSSYMEVAYLLGKKLVKTGERGNLTYSIEA